MIDVKNLSDVLKVLKENGVTHFKADGMELAINSEPINKTVSDIHPALFVPSAAVDEEKEKIEHKIIDLTSVMKLSDTDLVDSLFPDHTKDNEAS